MKHRRTRKPLNPFQAIALGQFNMAAKTITTVLSRLKFVDDSDQRRMRVLRVDYVPELGGPVVLLAERKRRTVMKIHVVKNDDGSWGLRGTGMDFTGPDYTFKTRKEAREARASLLEIAWEVPHGYSESSEVQ